MLDSQATTSASEDPALKLIEMNSERARMTIRHSLPYEFTTTLYLGLDGYTYSFHVGLTD